MRIGIDITYVFDQYAHRGIGTYGKEIVQKLVQNNEHEWILFGYGQAQANFSELKIKSAINIKFVSLGPKRNSTVSNLLFFKFKYLPKIVKEKLDIFFSPNFEQGLPIGKTRVAVIIHDVIPLMTNSYSTQNIIINYLKGIFYRHNLNRAKQADLILTISDFSKNELITKAGFDPAKVKRIYLGIKDIFRENNISNLQQDIRRTLATYNITLPYIINYGGIEPNKNIESLIKSFSQVAQRFPDLKLVIVNKDFKLGWDNKVKPLTKRAFDVLSLCNELKIRHRVVFTGEIKENHLPIILQNAKLMVHLSTYEGFGFSVLESLAAGTPLIAANKSSYPEILKDSAVLVNPLDLKNIAIQIEALLSDDKVRTKYRKAGLDRSELFQWQTTAGETLNALTAVTNVKPILKVTFLIPYFYPQNGGAENNCLALAKGLINNGAQVQVLTSYSKDFTCPTHENYQGITIHRFKRLNNLYYLGFYPRLFFALLKTKADIIHVHGIGFIWQDFCIFIKRLLSPKTMFINTPHGPFMALNNYSKGQRLQKTLYTIVLRLILNYSYDRVIEVNPTQTHWLVRYGFNKNKIRLLANGIDANLLESKPDKTILKKYNLSKKFVITFIGRFEEYKGLQFVVQALGQLHTEIKNIHLVALGNNGNYFSQIVNQVHENNLDKYVTLLVKPSDDIKNAVLESSQIFILPSQWEAFGISILEAMAKVNAIISTNTEGGKLLIKDNVNGYLVDYGNSQQIATKINTLYQNQELLVQIQAENKTAVKKYLWENIITDYFDILNETKTY